MTIKTWQERYNEACLDPIEGEKSARELISLAKQAEIDELRTAIESLAKDAERFNFLCDCENEQALDLLANHVGQREELIALVDELIMEAS